MKPGNRSDRVGEEVRQIVSLLIQSKLKDPRLGFVTITRVQLSADLRDAKVYYSVLGTPAERKASQIVLDRAKGFMQHALMKELAIKIVPQLTFKFDTSIEEAVHIESIIQKIHNEEKTTT